jgi:formylglycine-generating enzyme
VLTKVIARCALAVAVMAVASAAVAVQYDVFNLPSGQTSIQFVTVGDAGNAADTTGYGAVSYAYQIGKFDVTLGQYTQFLNAVAATDTYGLYNTSMAAGALYPTLGINRSGTAGSYTYTVAGSYDQGVNCPIAFVNWGDAARFCNWLQNGQPVGAQGSATTETGAYTLNGATTWNTLMAATRTAGATYFLPSESEWYKAAFYKGGSTNAGYWAYATQSNTMPSNVLSSTGTNNANYNSSGSGYSYSDPTNWLTPVGAFAASPGPYGTYDQAGEVNQWTESAFTGNSRVVRGGCCMCHSNELVSSKRIASQPTTENHYYGFRIASISVAEPASISLLAAGAIVGLIWWRRRK